LSPAVDFNRKPTVLLADDHAEMLKTVTSMLTPHFEVVAAVGDGKAALDAAARTDPDVAILDMAMPRLNGIQAAKELREQNSETKVIFLTAEEDDDYISAALDVGARGFVVKRRLRLDLLPALNLTLAGKFFISPQAFTETPKSPRHRHALELYFDDDVFFRHVSESAATALADGERVFMLLSDAGLYSVAKRLRAAGFDLPAAIGRGRYHSFTVENVVPLFIQGGCPQAARFEVFFHPLVSRAAALARADGSRVSIFSNVTAALLNQGWNAQVAARVEEAWSDLVSREFCMVHCGCPAMHLGSKEGRAALSRICGEHSNVIPIDR